LTFDIFKQIQLPPREDRKKIRFKTGSRVTRQRKEKLSLSKSLQQRQQLVNMFRALAILASFIGASAFAPASMRATSSALKMSFEDAIGAQGKIN